MSAINISNQLNLEGVIGFNGHVAEGLILHPDDEHLIYPLGSTIVVRNLLKNTQTFLQKDGHDSLVSAIALSKSGKYLVSGQSTHIGSAAAICLWNLETCELLNKVSLHKGKVEALAFSPDDTYFVSVGGVDDNRICLWDVETCEAICGSKLNESDQVCVVKFFHDSNQHFVTGGRFHLNVWTLDTVRLKLRTQQCKLGALKRYISSIVIDDDDKFAYCGTDSGDLIKVALEHCIFKGKGPQKSFLPSGIKSVLLTNNGDIVVGSGDGTIAVLRSRDFRIIRQMKLDSEITSLQLNANGDHFFVSTIKCNIYLVHLDSFEYELRNTCHDSRINDIAFAYNYSELFATCSFGDIRIWNARTRNELLRIEVPNCECLCVGFTQDGKSIISGWEDGKIRAFRPQSGKLIYSIKDAHPNGVVSLTSTQDSSRLISGGKDGTVRVWDVSPRSQRLVASMKEHKRTVNHVELNSDDTECLSCSDDGACIIWDLERFERNNAMFASTQFKCCTYHPDESQLLTTGSDRKITYWDTVDAEPIRVMDGSNSQCVNTLDIAADGDSFVSGSTDQMIKVWHYDSGDCLYEGIGHSGPITKLKISPDQQHIVSVGAEGGIFIWVRPNITGDDDDDDDGY